MSVGFFFTFFHDDYYITNSFYYTQIFSKLIKLGICQQGFKDLFNKIYMLQFSGHISGFGLPVYM